MDTFPWTTIGEPSDISPDDFGDVLRTPYSGGYTATRPKNSGILKGFSIKWDVMTPNEWNSLLGFWRDHLSSDAFYFQFPYDLFVDDTVEFGGVSSEPGDFDGDVSYGSRIFTVRFLGTRFKQKRITRLWSASTNVEEVFSAAI